MIDLVPSADQNITDSTPIPGESPKTLLTTGLQSTQTSAAVSMDEPKQPTKKRRGTTRERITIKQKAFISNLTNPDSSTFGLKGPSAVKAGYPFPTQAFAILKKEAVRNEIEGLLRAHNATPSDRIGVIAEILHKPDHVTKQYDGNGRLTSKTVVDNGKLRLQAAKELSKLDGSYHRAELYSHAQQRILDGTIDAWTKQLRKALIPHSPPNDGSDAVVDTQSIVVDTDGIPATDALQGQDDGIQGNPLEGPDPHTDTGGGGLGTGGM